MTDAERFAWDFFLAHAGPDKSAAETLYELLSPHARVFLDSRCVMLGDDWDRALPEAQATSAITVVLISPKVGRAYYQREEIAAAVAMARQDSEQHRVVPVYLDSEASGGSTIPYGLRIKHGLTVTQDEGLVAVAQQLVNLLNQLRQKGTATSSISAPVRSISADTNLWMQVPEIVNFNGLKVPCILCEGDGRFVFSRDDIKCHYIDAETDYPSDIESQIDQVNLEEQERRQRGERYAWNGKTFGLKDWFSSRTSLSEIPILHLSFKPTTYYEFLGTNMILDKKCVYDSEGHLISLRDKYASRFGWDQPTAVFSNQFGVVMSATTKDGYWIAVKRSERVRWVPNTFQTSIGEAMSYRADRDEEGRPDLFKTAIRAVREELGIEIQERSINFLGLIYDVNFYQYDMMGLIRLEVESDEVATYRALGTKDGRFESKQLFLVRYEPYAIVEFLAENQPWWPRSVTSILYCLAHDFGFQTVKDVMRDKGLTQLEYKSH